MQKEAKDLEYTLMGVMHSVDKWLDGKDLKLDEVNRAARMREITLQLIETMETENEKLKDEQGVLILCLNRLISLCCKADIGEACSMCKSNNEDCHGDYPEWSGLENIVCD